jgi:membrane-associated phospholipid phosphatase
VFVAAFVAVFAVLWILFLAGAPLLGRFLARTAHLTASFRYRNYLPVAVVLAAGMLATALAGDAFLDIAERVHANSPQVQEIDSAVHRWAATTRTEGSTLFFVTMTTLGAPITLGVIVTIVSGFLVLRKRWRWAAFLFVSTGAGALLNLALKSYFARARPELADALRTAHGYSFPSGHAMGSTVVFGALAYLAVRSLRTWKGRSAALSLAATLILSIAVSRVYLGVHWISDIVAGIAAGTLWMTTVTVAYEVFRRIRHVRARRALR